MVGIFWEMEEKVEIVSSREAVKNTVQQQLRVSHLQQNLLAATLFWLISSSYAESLCSLYR